MLLTKTLCSQSIIILADTFNTSVFNQFWLVSNNFIDKDSIAPTSLFAPGVTNVVSADFNLLVVPEQLQFSSGYGYDRFQEHVQNTLIPIIKALPAIQYKALGLNFIWNVSVEDMSFEEASRKLFAKADSKVFDAFQDDDSLFGAYLSKFFLEFRLNLDIKPIINQKDPYFRFAFNYHRALEISRSHEELLECLNKRGMCNEETIKILDC